MLGRTPLAADLQCISRLTRCSTTGISIAGQQSSNQRILITMMQSHCISHQKALEIFNRVTYLYYLLISLLDFSLKAVMFSVLETQRTMNARESFHEEYAYEESLPSYTIVTGLPSYDQAMEQFRQLRSIRKASSPKIAEMEGSENSPASTTFAGLSLGEIFQFYKVDKNLPVQRRIKTIFLYHFSKTLNYNLYFDCSLLRNHCVKICVCRLVNSTFFFRLLITSEQF